MITRWLEKIGRIVLKWLGYTGEVMLLLGETLRQMKKPPRLRLVFAQMAHLGVDTLPIVALTLLFTGMVMTLQVVHEFIRFGAQATIGGVIAIAIGRELTKGLGTGGVTDIGEAAAKSDAEKIKAAMQGADLVFVTASMGGGAGTGAAPVVAKIAKDMGILTVGVVTVPFSFEGARKKRIANEGIAKMQGNLDALIAIQNDNLMKLPENKHMSLVDAFKAADDVLRQAIRCITELILTTGVINVDFADVRNTMVNKGIAHMGIGSAKGENRALEAAKQAIFSPLLETTVKGAKALLLNVTAPKDSFTVSEFQEASQFITENVEREDVETIIGTAYSDDEDDKIVITVIATGFDDDVEMISKEVFSKGKESDKKQNVELVDTFTEPQVFKIPDWMKGKK